MKFKKRVEKIRHIQEVHKKLFPILILFLVLITTTAAAFPPDIQDDLQNQDPIPQQSTTGPEKPSELVLQDLEKPCDTVQDTLSETLILVPSYLWRHGCGPTALGMVVGFFDSNGFEGLIPGSAWTQTEEVDQSIASGGSDGAVFPPGQRGHYEDYSLPIDGYPEMLPDAYLAEGIQPHQSDSLADFMHTSQSTYNNYYGWSWSNHVAPAFEAFVRSRSSSYDPIVHFYYRTSMTWSVLQSEIDQNRPMVFLVDSNSDGNTDHFVTIIGYRTSPTLQYAIWDTWSNTVVRWEDFAYIQAGVPWGIWGGWSFNILLTPSLDNTLYLPIISRD